MSYKKKLTEARKLLTQGCLSLYDRVRLLIEVFEDREFRVQENLESDDAAGNWLTEGYLSDTADWDFFALKNLMDHAPNREQWGSGKLNRLYAEMLEAKKAQHNTENQPAKRTRITREEHEEVKKALQHEQAQVKYLRDQHSEVLEENQKLREEVALLKGRIQELERMAKLELAAA
jgi:alpha-D-ribose 1-methylphosphonate 5-triphosphate diphosphatase PhnM